MQDDRCEGPVGKLVSFVSQIKLNTIAPRKPYYHMGATISDSVLQAGINYRYVVYPRIKKLAEEFPDYRTTCDFIELMRKIPLAELLTWKSSIKLERIRALTRLLHKNAIQDEEQLAVWMRYDGNIKRLSEIKGIGPKTIDYLKMLAGIQTIAVDRHLFKFLELAGVVSKNYQEVSGIYRSAAEILGMTLYELDKKVWIYMSNTR